MKLLSDNKIQYFVSGMAMILAIFIFLPVYSQETATNKSKSTIKLKIVSEKNGETSVFDTTIVSDELLEKEEIEAMVEGMNDEMKELSEEMKEMQFEINFDIPDSLLSDSVHKIVKKAMRMMPGACCPGRKMPKRGRGNSFGFNFPCIPDCPTPPEMLKDMECGNWFPGQGAQRQRMLNPQETVSDIIGDIPLDKVKSYSIKDRKGGKRIIIDVDDSPIIEKQERIIYRERPNDMGRYRYMDRNPKDVKVIIRTKKDDTGKAPKVETPETPSKPGENTQKM
jgi:ribosome-associated toxin RatA of RatAB toxin-antitoxin module